MFWKFIGICKKKILKKFDRGLRNYCRMGIRMAGPNANPTSHCF